MTALDIIVLILLGGGAVFGFMRGFVHEILSLCAWVLAIVAVWLFYAPVSAYLDDKIGTPGGAAVLGYALVFIVTFAIGKFIASWLGGKTRSSLLGPFDRVLGFGFGAVKGLMVATAIFLAITIVYETVYPMESRPDWMTQSRTYPLLNATAKTVIDYVGTRRAMGEESDPGADNGQ